MFSGPGRATVIVYSRRRGVVREAIIVKVDLGTALLQHLDNVVERAKAVCVFGTSRVGFVQWDNGVVSNVQVSNLAFDHS